jgi:hypothetical protein
MRHDWILDVLTDMRAYAERNGMARLAGALDEVVPLARSEIAEAEARDRSASGKGG